MLYFHQSSCISPQQTFSVIDLEQINEPVNNSLPAIEPNYTGIPPGVLRRMGKAVRLGVGAAMPLLQTARRTPDGILIGTPMGGLEDCIKFLNQVIEYNEGMLTPTNFVQSTANAVAGQLGLLSKNNGYNITHTHRGLAFENALIDTVMLLREHPGSSWLAGSVDEISAYNYNIEYLGGWYKKELVNSRGLYTSNTPGSIAGEGSVMFIVNDESTGANACLSDIQIFQSGDEELVASRFRKFIEKNFGEGEQPHLLMTGENGDPRFLSYYSAIESIAGDHVPVARFKHMSGEYPAAASMAVWLACQIIASNKLPGHMLKSDAAPATINNIVIYNNYKGLQHSMMLLCHP